MVIIINYYYKCGDYNYTIAKTLQRHCTESYVTHLQFTLYNKQPTSDK